jgi:signal transduction histidine kinase
LVTSAGIALGNTLEAVLGAWLVNRYANGSRAFERTTTIFNFVFLAALASTVVSATCGVLTLCLGGFAQWSKAWPIWLTWWLGDMISDVIVAPLLLVWCVGPRPKLTRSQIVEALGVLAAVLWVGDFVFMGANPFAARGLPLEYLAIPPLLYAAFQFGQHGALTSSLIMSGLALFGTFHSHGPFNQASPNQSLLLLQAFMGTITLTSVVLASIIQERKRSEQALHQAREELHKYATELEHRVRTRTATLQDTVQSLESLCYTIAHDLRAPLRAMAGYGDVLAEDYDSVLDQSAKEYLVRLKAAARRMDQLILDLLQLGRVGSMQVALADLKLEEVAREALRQIDLEIQATRTEVLIKEPLLPVHANRPLLEQILLNLFSNAIKFARPGTQPRVQVWTEARENLVRVCVQDNGVGIGAEHRERIFQPFEKLVNHSAATGTGIGLAIVRKGVERMGGRVGVESNPGEGSCFWLELLRAGDEPSSPWEV